MLLEYIIISQSGTVIIRSQYPTNVTSTIDVLKNATATIKIESDWYEIDPYRDAAVLLLQSVTQPIGIIAVMLSMLLYTYHDGGPVEWQYIPGLRMSIRRLIIEYR